jgi:hypothetical protein
MMYSIMPAANVPIQCHYNSERYLGLDDEEPIDEG